MKAMILAGGMSTRLYPLTKAVPKPLVPLAGAPNTVHLIRYLASYGFDEIAINVHYLAEMIVDRLGDGSRYGVKLHYSHEATLMGSAGGVKIVEPFLRGNDPFVVIGCDEVTNIPLDRLVAFHRAKGALASIGLVECDEVDQYGVVITDAQDRIVDFQEKPPKGTERSKRANTGIYVFNPEIFDRIPADTFYDFGKQVFPELQRDGAPFYGYNAEGAYWRDIGTPGEYRAATRDILAERMRLAGAPEPHNGMWIGDAAIAPSARLRGACVVGDGVVIGEDAVVEDSILWEGAEIGAGAHLRNTIAGFRYRVAPGTELTDAIVANEPQPA